MFRLFAVASLSLITSLSGTAPNIPPATFTMPAGVGAQSAILYTHVTAPCRDCSRSIWVMNADGSNQAPAAGLAGGSNWDAHWNPNGQGYAYTNTHSGQDDVHYFDFLRSRDTLIAANARRPAVSPDGRYIAYVDNVGKSSIWIAPLDGSWHKMIYAPDQGVSRPDWAPDGVHMSASLTDSAGNATIVEFDIRTGASGASRVLVSENAPSNETYSPDGQWIAYQEGSNQPNGGQYNVYIRNTITGEKLAVSTDGLSYAPSWDDTGRFIYYVSFATGLDLIKRAELWSMQTVTLTKGNDYIPMLITNPIH